MADLKFPTLEELGRQAGDWALDEFEYKGLTIRQWADKITSGWYQPVKHGHWIKDDSKLYLKYKCSECGNAVALKCPYCENCGAKMDEEGTLEKQEPAKKTKAKEEAE